MTTGPHCTCAAFVDQVIEGKDGTLSAIRFIDTVTLTIWDAKSGKPPLKSWQWRYVDDPRNIAFYKARSPAHHLTHVRSRQEGAKRSRQCNWLRRLY